MDELDSQLEKEKPVDVRAVLAAISERVDPDLPLPDRIEVKRGSPYEWAYRLYFRDRPDYEGGVITFQAHN